MLDLVFTPYEQPVDRPKLTLVGNKPPWTLPAKAAYGKFDGQRACKYFGVPPISTPDFFPILSIMVSYLSMLLIS